MQRKNKTELSSLRFEDFQIQRYQGPKNSSNNVKDSTILYLAKAAFSLRTANGSDFYFAREWF